MPCSSSLRRRVCTLPRMSTISRSGRSASSCERRLRLEVPTVAPWGSSSRELSVADAPPTNTSRTSSRAVKATMTRPSGTSVGMSLAECTARSVRPSSMAVSSSLVNSPLSPSLASGASSSLSPLVWITSISTRRPGCSRISSSRTHSLWMSASLLPREPMRRAPLTRRPCPCRGDGGRWLRDGSAAPAAGMLVRDGVPPPGRPGAPSGRLDAAEIEEGAHGVDVEIALLAARDLLHLHRRQVEDLVDDARGEHVDLGALLVAQVAELAAETLELGAADLLHRVAQRGDRRHDLEAAQPVVHAAQLLLDDALGVVRLFLALAAVLLDHMLQVVDVVEVGVAHTVDLGVEVARHGDVDEEDGPVPAVLQRALDTLTRDDVVRRRGGADDDVGGGQVHLRGPRRARRGRRPGGPAPPRRRTCGW